MAPLLPGTSPFCFHTSRPSLSTLMLSFILFTLLIVLFSTSAIGLNYLKHLAYESEGMIEAEGRHRAEASEHVLLPATA